MCVCACVCVCVCVCLCVFVCVCVWVTPHYGLNDTLQQSKKRKVLNGIVRMSGILRERLFFLAI